MSWVFYLYRPIGFIAQLLSSGHHSVRIPIAPPVLRRYRNVNRMTASLVVVTLVVSAFQPFVVLLVVCLFARWALLRRCG